MSQEDGRVVFVRRVGGPVLDWVTYWVVRIGGFALLRATWPEYALAEPQKPYTLTMPFVLLSIFSSMIAATSAVTTMAAEDKRLAWIAGGLILALSTPWHLYPG